MIRFFIVVISLAIVLLVVLHLGYNQGWISQVPSFVYETTSLVIFTTGLIYIYLYKSVNPAFFVQLYLLSMVIKLIAYFAYNLIMILDDRPGAVINVLYFLVTYFIFTAVEISFLYRKISPRSKG